MLWTNPKTNWLSSDIFYWEDWTRIVSNALYLYRIMGEPFEWLDCTLVGPDSLPYYDIVNNLEENLKRLSQISIYRNTYFSKKVWQPRTHVNYTHNPSYRDFNRWESFEYTLFNQLSDITNLYSGNIVSSNDRVRQILGRSNNL